VQEPLECVVIRSDQEAIVINLDIEAVEKPESVAWIDPIHRGPDYQPGFKTYSIPVDSVSVPKRNHRRYSYEMYTGDLILVTLMPIQERGDTTCE
jgi:hypothetical protein